MVEMDTSKLCRICGSAVEINPHKRGPRECFCKRCRKLIGKKQRPNRVPIVTALVNARFKCEACGTIASRLDVHHKDGNGCHKVVSPDNTPSNLIVLCHRCHMKLHGFTNDGIRISEIQELRDSGHTYESIGKIFGLSRQRIHQILKSRYG